jgi:LysM repeat protein
MKNDRIPTRRQPARQTLHARLFNRTKAKKQRATAATADGADMDEGGINISRSLSIIFAIHILAIGMIFIHKQYLSGRTETPGSETAQAPAAKAAPAAPARAGNPPMLSSGDTPYMVEKGDNYAIIAGKLGVDESELRNMNRGADIRAGVVLRAPQPKRIVAESPPEVAAIRDRATTDPSEQGLVEILPPVAVEQPQLIRAVKVAENESEPTVSGRTHTVKSGDNIWRISNQYKVSQKDLLGLNGITDPGKLKIGQVLKLP